MSSAKASAKGRESAASARTPHTRIFESGFALKRKLDNSFLFVVSDLHRLAFEVLQADGVRITKIMNLFINRKFIKIISENLFVRS